MKTRYLSMIVLITLMLALGNVVAADGLTLTPPVDSQRYRPLSAVTTTVYVVESKNTYMACKIDMDVDEIESAYLFINQNYAYNQKFDPKNLTKGIKISKEYIINGYIVFNMADYKGVVVNKYPNKVVIAVEKKDKSIVFSNTVLLTIATGDMSCKSVISGDKIQYQIKQGFLPIDPSTISLTANGNKVPYYYDNYNKTVTALLAPLQDGTVNLNLDFSVKDLRGQTVTIKETHKLSNIIETAQEEFTRIQLAKYIFDIAGFELTNKVFNFTDLDYIPYETRLILSTLKEYDIMMENVVGGKYTFNPNGRVTQKMLSDAMIKLVGRELYKAENPSSYVTVNQAIDVLLKTLAE